MKRGEIEDLVRKVLKNKPLARDYDPVLYVEVLRSIDPFLPMSPLIIVMQDPTLPSYESVTRIRRKFQEDVPEFRASASAENMRRAEEEGWIQWSRKRGKNR